MDVFDAKRMDARSMTWKRLDCLLYGWLFSRVGSAGGACVWNRILSGRGKDDGKANVAEEKLDRGSSSVSLMFFWRPERENSGWRKSGGCEDERDGDGMEYINQGFPNVTK